MVESMKKETSGVAKAAMATAAAVGGVTLLNSGLGGLLGVGMTPAGRAAAVTMAEGGGYVTKEVMDLTRVIAEKDAVIARQGAEKYADAQTAALAVMFNAELSKQKDDICALKAAMAMETERRACGDERLLTYVDGNFIKASKRLDSRHIDYHGVKPVIELDHDCCD